MCIMIHDAGDTLIPSSPALGVSFVRHVVSDKINSLYASNFGLNLGD